tara:strand:+ start:1109 stop:2020 length:912 start_codon:yes stop_codon:yes gene_type:complete
MQPNLVDQLEVFLAVAETGSFSAAAKQLGRAVSAVSYAIANLESQYGLTLFDRSTYRPQLTDDGAALLLDAEIIFRRLDRLNARVSALKQKQDVEIRLAVEARFNRNLLADAIAQFAQEYPHVNLRLKTAHDVRVADELSQGRADIALVALAPSMSGKGVDGRDLAVTRHHLIAAPDHPLARLASGFPLSVLDDHPQIILADYDLDTRAFDYRIHTTDVVIADSIEMQLALIRRGVGWGTSVSHEIAGPIARNELVELHCAAMEHPGHIRFGAIWHVKHPPGPAAHRLLDIIGDMDKSDTHPT